jgi:hypothetical protein
MICNLQKKVDSLVAAQQQASLPSSSSKGGRVSDRVDPGMIEDNEDADAFMKEVFGNMQTCPASFIISSTPPSKTTTVEVEEELPTMAVTQDAASEADTTMTTNTLTRTKVKRMSLEALKDVCKTKGLSTDGTKAVLQDRVLATVNDTDE